MLDLRVNNESLDLGAAPSITIDEESSVFSKDSIQGGYSYPFELPVTPRNRRILGFPERIEKVGPSIEQPFQLFAQGRLRASGTITVTEAGETYQANLIVGSGFFASKIKNKKLKDLDLGGLRNWEWKSEYKHPDDDFVLAPVWNAKFYEDTDFAEQFKTQKYKINAYENGSFNIASGSVVFVTAPFPFLHYIVKQIFYLAGITIRDNILITDPDYRDLVVYHNCDLGAYNIESVTKEVLIGLTPHGNPIYCHHTGSDADRTIKPFNLADLLPDMLISEFITSIRNLLNLAFLFDNDGTTVSILDREQFVLNPGSKDITHLVSGTPNVESESNEGFKLEWSQDTADSNWGSDYFTSIDDVIEYLKDPVATVEELDALTPDKNEIRYVTEVNLYFRYVYFAYDPNDETKKRWQWVSWSKNYQNYRSGDESEVFTSKCTPIDMVITRFDESTGMMRMPYVAQPGNFPASEEVRPFSLRLLFYRGMIQDSLGNNYPYLSNDNLDRVGDQLEGKNLCLRFEGEFGLYRQKWQRYLSWWVNKRVVSWTITHPSVLQFNKKYTIDGKDYLLKKRSPIFAITGEQPSEAEFYLV